MSKSSGQEPDAQPPAPAPAEIDDSDADPTLIRAMLALTPEQRLERLQGHVNSLWELGLGGPSRVR